MYESTNVATRLADATEKTRYSALLTGFVDIFFSASFSQRTNDESFAVLGVGMCAFVY